MDANCCLRKCDCCCDGFVRFIFLRSMDSKALRISCSLFYRSMYANLVTFLHFLEQLTNSSPMIENRYFCGTSMFLAIVCSTDSSLSMSGWSETSRAPHSSLEQTDCWQMTSCWPIWLSLNALLHVKHLIKYLLNILVTRGDGVRQPPPMCLQTSHTLSSYCKFLSYSFMLRQQEQ